MQTDPIDDILRREGGFVDHPADRGGPTNFGITQATLSAWRGRQATVNDVRLLPRAEARQIYADQFIVQPRFDKIADARLRHLVIDAGVHSGPARAAQWLQAAAGVTADGVVGPRTLAAVNTADARVLYNRFLAQRVRFIGRLITNDTRQAAFAAGWANRIAEFLEA